MTLTPETARKFQNACDYVNTGEFDPAQVFYSPACEIHDPGEELSYVFVQVWVALPKTVLNKED